MKKMFVSPPSLGAPRWTIGQAARVWGMSEGALRRRVKSGHIEAAKGSSTRSRAVWLVEEATVQALLAARWCSKEENEVEVATK